MRIQPHSTAIFILLCGFGLAYATPIWDSDFWWHLASGRWIFEQQTLPLSDPFGVFGDQDPIRNQTVLQGQWLGQLIFYAIYQLAGSSGIVIFRVTILLLCLLLIHARLRQHGCSTVTSLAITVVAGFVLLGFTAERPQLLSSGLSALTFWLLDRAEQLRQPRLYLLLPLIGLLWANIHGGVILALVLLSVYASIWWFIRLRSRTNDPLLKPFSLALAAFAAMTLLTPNGFNSYRYIFQLQGSELQHRTSEYVSSLLVYQQGHWELQGWIGLVLILALASLPGLSRLDWRLAAIVAVLIALSIESFRYLVFLLTIGLPYVGLGLNALLSGRHKAVSRPGGPFRLLGITTASIGLLLWLHPPLQLGGINTQRYPTQLTNGLEGRGFNLMRWGGYLLWHAPQATPYIDGRMLEGGHLTPYTHILWSTTEGIRWFEQAQFSWTLIPYYDAAGEVYALNSYLKNHPGWYVAARGDHGYLYRRR